MSKFLIRTAIILLMFLVSGCSDSVQIVSDQFVSGLEIPEMTSGLGSLEGKPDEQVFTYTVTLVNTNIYEVEIQWVEPILSNELETRVLAENRKISVNKTIAPGGLLEISGQFSFSAKGYTKEQILEWEPFMKNLRVASVAALPLPVTSGN